MATFLSQFTEPYRFSVEQHYNSLVSSHFSSPQNAELVLSIAVFIGLYWALGGLFFLLDLTRKPAFLYRYKIQPQSSQVNSASVRRLLKQVLLNQALTVLFTFALSSVRWSTPPQQSIPSLSRLVLEFTCFLLVEEVCFYYSHRLLHHPSLYRHIHKRHHEWQTPIAVTALYCHPLEHLLSNYLPVVLGPALLSSHTLTILLWTAVVISSTLSDHSGYYFPWMISSPMFHDYHHLQFGNNFGVIGLLDWLHGTDRAFRQSKYSRLHQRAFLRFTTPTESYEAAAKEKQEKSAQ